jgi:hypothetical protein
MADKRERDRTYWLTCASVARTHAEEAKDPLVHRDLVRIADLYERIARICVIKLVKNDNGLESA